MNEIKIRSLLQQIESLEITNDDELQNANELAKKTQSLIKDIKADHHDEIKKYYDLHKQAKAKEKEELKPVEEAKKILASAIGDYMKTLEARQIEQQQEEQELFGEVLTQKVNLKGTYIRKKWKAKITDAKQVPLFYKKICIRPIDEKMLNEIAVQEQGRAKIDGVEFYQDETVVVKS